MGKKYCCYYKILLPLRWKTANDEVVADDNNTRCVWTDVETTMFLELVAKQTSMTRRS